MSEKNQDLAERIGRTINELDIDFSRFTFAGWIVSAASLASGGIAAWVVYEAMPKRVGPDNGPALALGLTMIGATVVSFLALRWLSQRIGFPITRSRSDSSENSD